VLYHIAAAPDWAQAQRDGEYRISTRGRTLEQEGFIHASTAAQVAPVANAFYRDHPEPLLVLVLEPARLGAEIRWEPAPGFADPFPHIYGPVPAAAVRRAVPLERGPGGQFTFPAAAATGAEPLHGGQRLP
jgi:uncharacterized protein (DUF952 family)